MNKLMHAFKARLKNAENRKTVLCLGRGVLNNNSLVTLYEESFCNNFSKRAR